MALTKCIKELVQSRAANDPAFGAALLHEGIDTMLAGDIETGNAILRVMQIVDLERKCLLP